MHIASWQAAYRGQLPDAYLDGLGAELARRTAFWSRWLADDGPARGQRVLVAEESAHVLGFVSFGPSEGDAGVGEVYAIYLEPRAWGSGVGRALFTTAAAALRAEGRSEATLWVLATNERARRFYEAAGWAPDGTARQERRGDLVLDEVRYRGRL